MTLSNLTFTISFEGADTDRHQIDFYDVSEALRGFQRSLAITAHLIINGQVITQAPSLKGAKIIALPPEEGSWKFTAIISSSIMAAGMAPNDSPIGHLMYSAYDYVISESLGFHVDYEKTLGAQYEEMKKSKDKRVPILDKNRFDSAIEKCTFAIQEMHRPIVKSETALQARIIVNILGQKIPLSRVMDKVSYAYMLSNQSSEEPVELLGRVSSYNINTFKGRFFMDEYNRPIPFELTENARASNCVNLITKSLTENASDRQKGRGNVGLLAYKNYSRSDQLKKLIVINVDEIKNTHSELLDSLV